MCKEIRLLERNLTPFEYFRCIKAEDECGARERWLYIAIEGKENKPKDMTDNVFKEKDDLAMADLLLALDESALFNVSEETTSKGLWDKLTKPYEGKNMSNRIFLRRQL